MATKKFLISFMLLILPFLSYAQDDSINFFSELRYFQRLSWSGDEYALRYELIIEKEEGGLYKREYFENTNKYTTVVSLHPGKYRYQVIPYNYLDNPVTGTGWIEFEVHAALNPVLERYIQVFDYVNTGELLLLNVFGKNIQPNAIITLTEENGTVFVPDGIDVAKDGSSITFTFNDAYSIKQFFKINIKNQSGLEASMEVSLLIPPPPAPSWISYFKKPEFYISFSIMPTISLYGNANWMAVQDVAMSWIAFRLGSVFTRKDAPVGMGFEIAVSWQEIETERVMLLDFNLLAQVHAPNDVMAFKFRAGIGYCPPVVTDNIDYYNWQLFYINIGVHFRVLLFKYFYLETGVDCVYWPGAEIQSGALRPMAGLGFRFM
jgi:hypothetical protein